MDDESFFFFWEEGEWKGRGIGSVYCGNIRDYNPIPPLSFSFSFPFPFLGLVLVVSYCSVYFGRGKREREGRGRLGRIGGLEGIF